MKEIILIIMVLISLIGISYSYYKLKSIDRAKRVSKDTQRIYKFSISQLLKIASTNNFIITSVSVFDADTAEEVYIDEMVAREEIKREGQYIDNPELSQNLVRNRAIRNALKRSVRFMDILSRYIPDMIF